RLQPGKTILDSSSGNAGIAYAMVGRIIGYPVEIVIPNNASTEAQEAAAGPRGSADLYGRAQGLR
ncbi:MAG TPA: pyridoxal-phosphate dependent enzyme, partial [Methylomirabilota bacterium]|nr:pyridoxal-phosphate dependent enzyme [Methylomirabilota bacterium]